MRDSGSDCNLFVNSINKYDEPYGNDITMEFVSIIVSPRSAR